MATQANIRRRPANNGASGSAKKGSGGASRGGRQFGGRGGAYQRGGRRDERRPDRSEMTPSQRHEHAVNVLNRCLDRIPKEQNLRSMSYAIGGLVQDLGMSEAEVLRLIEQQAVLGGIPDYQKVMNQSFEAGVDKAIELQEREQNPGLLGQEEPKESGASQAGDAGRRAEGRGNNQDTGLQQGEQSAAAIPFFPLASTGNSPNNGLVELVRDSDRTAYFTEAARREVSVTQVRLEHDPLEIQRQITLASEVSNTELVNHLREMEHDIRIAEIRGVSLQQLYINGEGVAGREQGDQHVVAALADRPDSFHDRDESERALARYQMSTPRGNDNSVITMPENAVYVAFLDQYDARNPEQVGQFSVDRAIDRAIYATNMTDRSLEGAAARHLQQEARFDVESHEAERQGVNLTGEDRQAVSSTPDARRHIADVGRLAVEHPGWSLDRIVQEEFAECYPGGSEGRSGVDLERYRSLERLGLVEAPRDLSEADRMVLIQTSATVRDVPSGNTEAIGDVPLTTAQREENARVQHERRELSYRAESERRGVSMAQVRLEHDPVEIKAQLALATQEGNETAEKELRELLVNREIADFRGVDLENLYRSERGFARHELTAYRDAREKDSAESRDRGPGVDQADRNSALRSLDRAEESSLPIEGVRVAFADRYRDQVQQRFGQTAEEHRLEVALYVSEKMGDDPDQAKAGPEVELARSLQDQARGQVVALAQTTSVEDVKERAEAIQRYVYDVGYKAVEFYHPGMTLDEINRIRFQEARAARTTETDDKEPRVSLGFLSRVATEAQVELTPDERTWLDRQQRADTRHDYPSSDLVRYEQTPEAAELGKTIDLLWDGRQSPQQVTHADQMALAFGERRLQDDEFRTARDAQIKGEGLSSDSRYLIGRHERETAEIWNAALTHPGMSLDELNKLLADERAANPAQTQLNDAREREFYGAATSHDQMIVQAADAFDARPHSGLRAGTPEYAQVQLADVARFELNRQVLGDPTIWQDYSPKQAEQYHLLALVDHGAATREEMAQARALRESSDGREVLIGYRQAAGETLEQVNRSYETAIADHSDNVPLVGIEIISPALMASLRETDPDRFADFAQMRGPRQSGIEFQSQGWSALPEHQRSVLFASLNDAKLDSAQQQKAAAVSEYMLQLYTRGLEQPGVSLEQVQVEMRDTALEKPDEERNRLDRWLLADPFKDRPQGAEVREQALLGLDQSSQDAYRELNSARYGNDVTAPEQAIEAERVGLYLQEIERRYEANPDLNAAQIGSAMIAEADARFRSATETPTQVDWFLVTQSSFPEATATMVREDAAQFMQGMALDGLELSDTRQKLLAAPIESLSAAEAREVAGIRNYVDAMAAQAYADPQINRVSAHEIVENAAWERLDGAANDPFRLNEVTDLDRFVLMPYLLSPADQRDAEVAGIIASIAPVSEEPTPIAISAERQVALEALALHDEAAATLDGKQSPLPDVAEIQASWLTDTFVKAYNHNLEPFQTESISLLEIKEMQVQEAREYAAQVQAITTEKDDQHPLVSLSAPPPEPGLGVLFVGHTEQFLSGVPDDKQKEFLEVGENVAQVQGVVLANEARAWLTYSEQEQPSAMTLVGLDDIQRQGADLPGISVQTALAVQANEALDVLVKGGEIEEANVSDFALSHPANSEAATQAADILTDRALNTLDPTLHQALDVYRTSPPDQVLAPEPQTVELGQRVDEYLGVLREGFIADPTRTELDVRDDLYTGAVDAVEPTSLQSWILTDPFGDRARERAEAVTILDTLPPASPAIEPTAPNPPSEGIPDLFADSPIPASTGLAWDTPEAGATVLLPPDPETPQMTVSVADNMPPALSNDFEEALRALGSVADAAPHVEVRDVQAESHEVRDQRNFDAALREAGLVRLDDEQSLPLGGSDVKYHALAVLQPGQSDIPDNGEFDPHSSGITWHVGAIAVTGTDEFQSPVIALAVDGASLNDGGHVVQNVFAEHGDRGMDTLGEIARLEIPYEQYLEEPDFDPFWHEAAVEAEMDNRTSANTAELVESEAPFEMSLGDL